MPQLMTNNVTEVFVTHYRGMDGNLKCRPVRTSDVALASLRQFGNLLWENYDEHSLRSLANQNGWTLRLYDDDDELEAEWRSFRYVVNQAIAMLDETIGKIDTEKFWE